jgi:hypothetical protein
VEGRAPARGGRLLRGDASRYAAARSTVPVLEAPQGRSHRNRSHLGDCSRRISRELICSKQSSAQPSSTEAELIGADPGVQARGRPPAARFVADSLLEGPGFELSVPRKRDRFLKFAHQMAARKAYAQQSSAITTTTGSSIPPGLNREPATMRPDSAGHCTKKLLEIRTTPSSVPARRS